jgi:hypothetical protein
MGQSQKLLQQTEFLENLKRGRMYRVAAKIAEEVLVLFEHCNLHAPARQKISEHHACGSAAYHAASCLQNFVRHT